MVDVNHLRCTLARDVDDPGIDFLAPELLPDLCIPVLDVDCGVLFPPNDVLWPVGFFMICRPVMLPEVYIGYHMRGGTIIT